MICVAGKRTAQMLFSAALLLAVPASVQAARDEIQWLDGARQVAAFVPESLLTTRDLVVTLPKVDRERLERLRTDLARPGTPANQSTCQPAPAAPAMASGAEVTSLPGLLGRSSQVVLVTVTEVEAGYSPWYGTVARRVSAIVDRSLQGRGVAPGESIVFIVPGGAARFVDGEVCQLPASGFTAPEAGNQWLLAGGQAPEVPLLFAVGVSFPVIRGQVLAQPYGNLEKSTATVALDVLSRVLAEAEVTK